MNSYIDKTTREDFTEDAAIRKAIDNIYDMLAELPKEERLAFFKQISKPKNLDFVKEVDGIYYECFLLGKHTARKDVVGL